MTEEVKTIVIQNGHDVDIKFQIQIRYGYDYYAGLDSLVLGNFGYGFNFFKEFQSYR